MDDMGVAAVGLTGKLKEVDHWYDDFATKWKAGVSNLSADIFGSVNLTPLEQQFNKAAASYNALKQDMAKGNTQANVQGQWVPIEQALELARQKAYALQQQLIETRKEATQQGAVAPLTKPGKDTSDHGEAQADRDAYNEQRLAHSMSLADEKAYWQAKMDAAKEGTQAYRQAVQQLLEIKTKEAAEDKAAGNKEATAAREAAREKVEAAKQAATEAMNSLEMVRAGTAANTAERIQADAAILASATKLYGALSSQQKAALNQMLADERSYAASYLKIQKDLEKQIEQDNKKYEKAIAKASADAYKKAAAEWHTYLDPIDHAFQASINGMIQGTQTLRQMTANILQSIAASYLQEGLKDLESHIITQKAKTAATVAGVTERQAIESGAIKKGMAESMLSQEKQIFNSAKVAAANTYASVSAIPFVGWAAAPLAAAGAFVAVEAFGNLSSAAGGWERVPADGMMTELHRDEMVLPKHVADPVRQMAKNGGNGGGQGVTINAMDARSFKDWSRRNMRDFAGTMKLAHRRGYLGN
jgi:hypothetical protein